MSTSGKPSMVARRLACVMLAITMAFGGWPASSVAEAIEEAGEQVEAASPEEESRPEVEPADVATAEEPAAEEQEQELELEQASSEEPGEADPDPEESQPRAQAPPEQELSATDEDQGESQAQGEQQEPAAAEQSAEVVDSGTCGTCPWQITADGVLTIGAGTLADGPTGWDGGSWPWHVYYCPTPPSVDFEPNGIDAIEPLHEQAESPNQDEPSSNDGEPDYSIMDCTRITKVRFTGQVVARESVRSMFKGFSSLIELEGLSQLATSNAKYMDGMFAYCESLQSLDLAPMNTSNVTSISHMFFYCKSLESLNVNSWNTASLVNMDYAFLHCEALQSLNLSQWSTPNLTSLEWTFKHCYALDSLDISDLDVSHVTNFSGMFGNCGTLTLLDLAGWNTGSAEDTSGMFDVCESLASFSIGEAYDTNKAGALPAATAANGKWWSTKAGAWFTVEEIASQRNGIADTYLNTGGATALTDISGATIAAVADQPWTGSEIKPTPTVTLNGTNLVKDTDYTLSYANNINVGTATIIVTGKGNYAGTKLATFNIERATPVLSFASSSVSKKTTDAAFTNALTKTTDGTVTFSSSNVEVAAVDTNTGQVTIKAAGIATITASAEAGVNYKAGSASYTLEVVRPVTYTVTFDANGGTGTPSAQSKEQGVSLTLSDARPTKSYLLSYNSCGGSVSPASKSVGCSFRGWNTKSDGSGVSYASGGNYAADADATLYAQWSNPTAGELATPSRSGFDFVGWFTSATGGSEVDSSSTVTGKMTLYAHWVDPYNLGDETYSFKNYSDDDAGGHCFGMSMTSAGYHDGALDIGIIGGGAGMPLFGFDDTAIVRRPICHYQHIQDEWSRGAIVAGGSGYLGRVNNISSDWDAVVNYVKNHRYDNTGLLQIGLRGAYLYYGTKKTGGHAINFLRYEKIGGQDRIYAYDNNFPGTETYFYRDSSGVVRQTPYQTFDVSIDCMALRDVRTYFGSVGSYDATHAIYMDEEVASVRGYSGSLMEGTSRGVNRVMYVIPADVSRVTIVPYRDNADFEYMGTEYSFGEVTVETRGELQLSTLDDEAGASNASFTVYELSSRVPTVTLSPTTYIYDGSQHKPKVTVKMDGLLLRESTDYSVEYPSGMVNAGTYEVKVALRGDYEGSVTKSFTIGKASQAVSASNKSVAMGKTVSLGAKRTKGDGKLTYASSNTAVAKVSAEGVVTPVKVGTAKVAVTAAGTTNWNKATKAVTVTVTKGAQPMTVKAVNRYASFETLKTKDVTVNRPLTVEKAQGALSYAKVTSASSAALSVNASTGKVTVKKGTKKGIYTIMIKVTAAGNANYKAGSLTASCKVCVRYNNTLAAKAKAATVSALFTTLKTKAVTLASNVAVSKAKGAVTYANVSANATAKKFSVNKTTGKVTVPKGTAKGKYQLKVKVAAAGDANYLAGSKTVSYYVQVK